MAMGILITTASGLAAVNVVLAAVLAGVWLRNYRTFRTHLILGLVGFAGVMLIENAVAVYFFLSMGMLYSGQPAAQGFVLLLRGLQFIALALLTIVTLK